MVIILVKFLYTEIFCIVYWDTKLKRKRINRSWQNTQVKNITRQRTQKFGTAALIKFHFHLKTFASYFVIKIFSPFAVRYQLSSVHRTPRKFKNAALFLRLGLPSTTFRHKSGKRSSKRRDLKKPAFRFRVDGKRFENVAFRKRCRVTIIMLFPWPSFLKHKSQMASDYCVFKFLRRGVDGKHLMYFQSDTSLFILLRRSVVRALLSACVSLRTCIDNRPPRKGM